MATPQSIKAQNRSAPSCRRPVQGPSRFRRQPGGAEVVVLLLDIGKMPAGFPRLLRRQAAPGEVDIGHLVGRVPEPRDRSGP